MSLAKEIQGEEDNNKEESVKTFEYQHICISSHEVMHYLRVLNGVSVMQLNAQSGCSRTLKAANFAPASRIFNATKKSIGVE